MSDHTRSEQATARIRRCWRCRAMFPVDDAVSDGELTDWWTCGPCHGALLPRADAGADRRPVTAC